jgi:hypothetical protein
MAKDGLQDAAIANSKTEGIMSGTLQKWTKKSGIHPYR